MAGITVRRSQLTPRSRCNYLQGHAHAAEIGRLASGVAVVMSKVANALIEDAEFGPGAGLRRTMDVAGATESVSFVLDRFKSHYGGLWVGGRLTLTDEALTFEPNAMNRAVHKELAVVTIPLTTITAVETLPGFVTKIIAIRAGHHIFKARCYGAKAFATHLTASLSH